MITQRKGEPVTLPDTEISFSKSQLNAGKFLFFLKLHFRFTHQAYNFYVFPSDYKDMNFTCQTKSITFLIENGFDFNKLFGQGIPYLKDSEVEKLLENLSEKQYKPQQFQTAMRGDTAPETMAIVKSVMTKIEDILESNSKETFVTEKYNSFLRRHIYCAVQKKYGFDIFVETNKDKSMTIAVGYSEVELKELQVESYLKQKHEILEEAGFTRVIKLIMESVSFQSVDFILI